MHSSAGASVDNTVDHNKVHACRPSKGLPRKVPSFEPIGVIYI